MKNKNYCYELVVNGKVRSTFSDWYGFDGANYAYEHSQFPKQLVKVFEDGTRQVRRHSK